MTGPYASTQALRCMHPVVLLLLLWTCGRTDAAAAAFGLRPLSDVSHRSTVDAHGSFAVAARRSSSRTRTVLRSRPVPSSSSDHNSGGGNRKENEDVVEHGTDEDPTPEELQRALNELTAPSDDQTKQWIGGFNPDSFDETKIPLPLFTAMVIFVGTTYLTGYFLYYGIVGFPVADELPPLF